jgi:pilus assembly protein CpaB
VGTLSLALRNQIDAGAPVTAGATKSTLLEELAKVSAREAPKPVAAPVTRRVAERSRPAPMPSVPSSRRNCINVLNGVQTSLECF